MKHFIESKVRGGTIRCYPNVDPDNPGVSVMYQPNGCDFEIDLVYIENTQLELEQTDNPEDLRVMVYDNVFSEDYQHSFTIREGDVKELVNQIQEDDSFVGTITLGEDCDITDPGYDKDVWCSHTLHDMLPGTYKCFAFVKECGIWGKRVVESCILHESISDMSSLLDYNPEEFVLCGVDSGLFSYFDDKPDYPDDAWDAFCDMLNEKRRQTGNPWDAIITDNGGFVTSSGFGDGCYYPVVYRNADGKVVAVSTRFIEAEEYEEEYEDD